MEWRAPEQARRYDSCTHVFRIPYPSSCGCTVESLTCPRYHARMDLYLVLNVVLMCRDQTATVKLEDVFASIEEEKTKKKCRLVNWFAVYA